MPQTDIKTRWYLEYALVRLIAFLAAVSPYKLSLAGAWVLAAILYPILIKRVNEAKKRINTVYENRLDKARVNNIAWISFRNTLFSAIEMLRLPITKKAFVDRIFDCEEAMQTFLQHAQKGKGAVIAVPHMGSWELACVATYLHEVPVFNIAAQQRNPLIDKYMNRLRSSPGIELLARGSSFYRQAIRLLQSGRFCAILPDVRMRSGGIEVNFLGGTANVGTGAAFFARMADVPIFPCVVTRKGWTRHRLDIFPAILPNKELDKKTDIERMTRSLLKIMDKEIRSQPEQWFWYNKRWVLDPINK